MKINEARIKEKSRHHNNKKKKSLAALLHDRIFCQK